MNVKGERYEYREGGRIKFKRYRDGYKERERARMRLTTDLATAKLENITTIADFLIEHNGNLSTVASILDVPRNLLDAKIRRTPSLHQIMKDLDARSVDMAREAIDELVQQRNVTAVTFVLRTLGKEKFSEKVTLEHELGPNTTAGIIAAMKQAEAEGDDFLELDGTILEDEDD